MRSANQAQTGPSATFLGIPFPWLMVAMGGLLLLSYTAYNYTFGVFFKPISGEFGWSRAAMAGAYAIRSLSSAALVVPMGHWADRYGPRRVLLPCFVIIGASMIAVSEVRTLWELYLQGAFIGIGTSGPFVCALSAVAKWHDKRRGLALGITSAGTGLVLTCINQRNEV